MRPPLFTFGQSIAAHGPLRLSAFDISAAVLKDFRPLRPRTANLVRRKAAAGVQLLLTDDVIRSLLGRLRLLLGLGRRLCDGGNSGRNRDDCEKRPNLSHD
jgi:hypothetical protein